MEQLLQDLRLAFRSLARRPMLTAVAAATLALAIGGNAAIFSVVKAVLLRPLPYADADRLVRVWDANPSRNIPRRPSSAVAWTAYRDQSGVFEVLAGSRDWMPNLTGSGDPESLIAYRFSAEMFPLLGVRTQLGRWFTAEETRPGREHVVVL
ncbi:MAG TPA: ABC transporter permease, partial [Vicinamibacteria bacterium]|nr:ABC transporter permease [Vicinamibacteria bacterium]